MIRTQPGDRLQAVELFDGLRRSELAAIDSLFTEIILPAGTDLMSQGGVGSEFFVIADGEVAVIRGRREVARLRPGDFVGELSLLDDGPRNATVRAVTDVRVLVQNRREFASLLDAIPAIRERIAAAAETRRNAA